VLQATKGFNRDADLLAQLEKLIGVLQRTIETEREGSTDTRERTSSHSSGTLGIDTERPQYALRLPHTLLKGSGIGAQRKTQCA
jgi:hypothetical protein